jgi:hypothetical protein
MPTIKTVTVSRVFNATGDGDELTIYRDGAAFVEGPFTGSFALECQPPGATGWLPVLVAESPATAVVLTGPGTFAVYEPRENTRYRWRCTALSSGTPRAGLSQA